MTQDVILKTPFAITILRGLSGGFALQAVADNGQQVAAEELIPVLQAVLAELTTPAPVSDTPESTEIPVVA